MDKLEKTISQNIMELCDCRIRSFAIELARELMKINPATKEQNDLTHSILKTVETFGGINVTQGRDRESEPDITKQDTERDQSSFESDLKSLGINPFEVKENEVE
jgi:hypothetical protein